MGGSWEPGSLATSWKSFIGQILHQAAHVMQADSPKVVAASWLLGSGLLKLLNCIGGFGDSKAGMHCAVSCQSVSQPTKASMAVRAALTVGFSGCCCLQVKADNPDFKITEIAKHIGEMWAKASDKEKEKYQKKADEVSWDGREVLRTLMTRFVPPFHSITWVPTAEQLNNHLWLPCTACVNSRPQEAHAYMTWN